MSASSASAVVRHPWQISAESRHPKRALPVRARSRPNICQTSPQSPACLALTVSRRAPAVVKGSGFCGQGGQLNAGGRLAAAKLPGAAPREQALSERARGRESGGTCRQRRCAVPRRGCESLRIEAFKGRGLAKLAARCLTITVPPGLAEKSPRQDLVAGVGGALLLGRSAARSSISWPRVIRAARSAGAPCRRRFGLRRSTAAGPKSAAWRRRKPIRATPLASELET